MFLFRHVVNAHAWLYHFHVRVLSSDEANHFGRVDAGKVHVCLVLHSCQLHKIVKYLAVLATTECVVESINGVEAQGEGFGFANKVDGVFDFPGKWLAGSGKHGAKLQIYVTCFYCFAHGVIRLVV